MCFFAVLPAVVWGWLPRSLPWPQAAAAAGRTRALRLAVPADAAAGRPTLTLMQHDVLRQKGTEPVGFSESEGGLEFALERDFGTKFPAVGGYACASCDNLLYWANHKMGCGCGWPAFWDAAPGAVREIRPNLFSPPGAGVEIVCATCDGHLGHVVRFEGFGTPTDARHCVNGCCLVYVRDAPQPEDVPRQYHLCPEGPGGTSS